MEKRVWLRGSCDLVENGKRMEEDVEIAIDDDKIFNFFALYAKLQDVLIFIKEEKE